MSRFRFLSTPSARRATVHHVNHVKDAPISIHALREEGDQPRGQRGENGVKFLSTPSARRATLYLLPEMGHKRFLSTPSARRATI